MLPAKSKTQIFVLTLEIVHSKAGRDENAEKHNDPNNISHCPDFDFAELAGS